MAETKLELVASAPPWPWPWLEEHAGSLGLKSLAGWMACQGKCICSSLLVAESVNVTSVYSLQSACNIHPQDDLRGTGIM